MKHSPYSSFDQKRMNYRDYLAMDRTTLANERTLLAYGRTALMILATGITLIKLFNSPGVAVLGYILIPLSVAMFLIGLHRYLKIRHAIDSALDRLLTEPNPPPVEKST
jgi:putative membrane protein